MSKSTSNISLSFIAKAAIICNFFYILSLMVMTVQWFKIPEIVSNFIAVLGLEMAPGVNIAFVLAWIWVKVAKKDNYVENWKTILIVLMLSMQVGTLFI